MDILIMHCIDGWYPIESSGLKSIEQEAKDHGELNGHIFRVEDMDGNVLWSRVN